MSNKEAFAKVFSEMSGKVQELKETTKPMNSARLSLGSLSSKLDARRQAFKARMTKQKETETETPSETEAKPEAEKEQKQEESEETPEKPQDGESPKEEEKSAEPKPSMKERMGAMFENKLEETEESDQPEKKKWREAISDRAQLKSDAIKEKYPALHEKGSYWFKAGADLWMETFPDTKRDVKNKMEMRKERAKAAKEWEEALSKMSEEELNAYME